MGLLYHAFCIYYMLHSLQNLPIEISLKDSNFHFPSVSLRNALFSLAVLLDAPDTVLIERVMGKRVDPITGGKLSILSKIFPQN